MLNLNGQKFNNLLIIDRALSTRNYGKNKAWHKCLCDCGNTRIVETYDLRSGRIKSCGCKNRLEKSESGFRRLYSNYKFSAKERNLSFSLTKEQFKELTKNNCNYCLKEPAMTRISNKTSKNIEHDSYIYNGIDRVDNNKGYEYSNCVACCKICNIAKQELSLEEFKEWLSRVYNNLIGDSK